MAKIKQVALAAVAGAAMIGATASPASAQRYCQRELAGSGEGCTAPVGGDPKTGDPRFSGFSVPGSELTDEEVAEQLADEAIETEAE